MARRAGQYRKCQILEAVTRGCLATPLRFGWKSFSIRHNNSFIQGPEVESMKYSRRKSTMCFKQSLWSFLVHVKLSHQQATLICIFSKHRRQVCWFCHSYARSLPSHHSSGFVAVLPGECDQEWTWESKAGNGLDHTDAIWPNQSQGWLRACLQQLPVGVLRLFHYRLWAVTH